MDLDMPTITSGGVVKDSLDSGPSSTGPKEHDSHLFHGWSDFLRHVGEVHRIDAAELTDLEVWLVHDSLHDCPLRLAAKTTPESTPM
jgi:hypothetical protein